MSANAMEFEASLTSGINPDIKRVKKYDEHLAKTRRAFRKFWKFTLLFVLLAAGCFLRNQIVGIILGILVLLIFLISIIIYRLLIHQTLELYTQSNLASAMIVSLHPLSIMVFTTLNIDDYHAPHHACLKLLVKELPDTPLSLYQKVPCSCGYGYKEGGYHYTFRPYPLCWATGNKRELECALDNLSSSGEGVDEYEIIRKISSEYPELKPNHMILLNEDYEPIKQKYYLDEEYHPLCKGLNTQFPKKYPEVKYVEDSIPPVGLYNRMIDLAVQNGVYEYISCCNQKDGNPYVTENTGLFTYIGDSVSFLDAVIERKISLQPDEYPLFGGQYMITTKGCWKKHQFIPWSDFFLSVDMDEEEYIQINVNKKRVTFIHVNKEYFIQKDSYTETDWINILKAEKQNFNVFLNDLQGLCQEETA